VGDVLVVFLRPVAFSRVCCSCLALLVLRAWSSSATSCCFFACLIFFCSLFLNCVCAVMLWRVGCVIARWWSVCCFWICLRNFGVHQGCLLGLGVTWYCSTARFIACWTARILLSVVLSAGRLLLAAVMFCLMVVRTCDFCLLYLARERVLVLFLGLRLVGVWKMA